MVIAEANAFGIPALVSDIGGISTLVQSGSNGFLFPPSAGGIEYAKTIFQVFRDSAWYQKLSKTSRQEYENRLNWDVWAREICQIGKEIS
jgi:glycosyltransferase involved in cell wall biosynthesis